MVFFYLPPGHGGYIPFVELPCERYIGETIQWILTLSLSPISCKIVPWVCCPLELGNSSITVNAALDCHEAGAVYASTAYWTMQAISIVGLIFAIKSVGDCFAGLVGAKIEPDVLPMTFDLSDLTSAVIQGIDVAEVKKEGQLNFVKKKMVAYLQDHYLKEQAKKKEKVMYEVEDPVHEWDGKEEYHMDHTKYQLEQLEEVYFDDDDDGGPPGGRAPRNNNNNNNTTTKEEERSNRRRRRSRKAHSRSKRQVVSVNIPTLQGFVRGGDDAPSDVCKRDEVFVDEDGECHQLLSQGPCEDEEVVFVDTYTKKGYCGPRLCPPERVFVFSDQMCHDPRELGVCPPGRMLFTSGFGTPVCGCPDGTYEEDDDPDEDVCEPVLGGNPCNKGQVFWFSDFKRPARCVSDPCGGLNEKRSEKELPYVPALYDGRCYQIGTQPSFCKSDQLYSISFELLKGVCSTLENAGFEVLDEDGALSFLSTGIDRNTPDSRRKTQKPGTTTKRKPLTPASTTLLRRPEIGSSVVQFGDHDEMFTHPSIQPLPVGGSVVPVYRSHDDDHNDEDNEVEDQPRVTLLPTHVNAFSPSLISVNGSVTFLSFLNGMLTPHYRNRRSPLPFASPGNVFEPSLSACRAGAKRDGNAKCRETVLPSHYPPARSRPRRSVPPVPPRPACPSGTFRNVARKCTASATGIASNINALGLG
ncbi:hypothetical protein Pcinc_023115 [Petrolisthes cinctipes]|uniref:DUF4789 domain-containing protein n=1 Tax=Petrolisthes cinctipes TaxID=88211 RepID=A0AAE1FCN3_PETCI|nr:hypothetical protein Pcinc_023115 [Petrolisthes cinctipes]